MRNLAEYPVLAGLIPAAKQAEKDVAALPSGVIKERRVGERRKAGYRPIEGRMGRRASDRRAGVVIPLTFPRWKRAFDILGSSLLLLFFAPALLVIAGLIALEGGPVFYSCARPGQFNRRIRMHKFRSMKPDADRLLAEYLAGHPQEKAEYEACFKLKNDPRITRVGSFLRRYSLDELPQLFNVLKGEMSLVGPRPRGYDELAQASRHDQAEFNAYFRTRPGMTGLWQVSGRSDTDYDTRVKLDAAYVRNMSLFRDIAILLRTIPAMVTGRGAY
ncbi:sugar transferase [Stappia sp. F7233]|uniref:Sugar transferase n=1 Tax=Stappia albiluteola TaxID=2758565 RepID=A0A839ADN0_9HYPH|nr:sugar transferase [Stappia albiluteola]MBA5777138.1 sugar transferase [Stappia albiluteola]